MYRVVKQIDFCYGHRLMNYEGMCKHPHGHNGRVEIELSSEGLDERGMVADFGDIKKAVKKWIDEKMDHRMILRRDDPLISVFRKMKEPFYLMDENPTAENIAKEIYQYVASQKFPVTEIRFWESVSSFAVYRPSSQRSG
ncbi:MAG: 6-carboxytetrahydropterin synthase [Deltaproteobacteria bacterium]|nr:6-carboxytetrahydropterin synthase [Deltaproteobacteria bacterium]